MAPTRNKSQHKKKRVASTSITRQKCTLQPRCVPNSWNGTPPQDTKTCLGSPTQRSRQGTAPYPPPTRRRNTDDLPSHLVCLAWVRCQPRRPLIQPRPHQSTGEKEDVYLYRVMRRGERGGNSKTSHYHDEAISLSPTLPTHRLPPRHPPSSRSPSPSPPQG